MADTYTPDDLKMLESFSGEPAPCICTRQEYDPSVSSGGYAFSAHMALPATALRILVFVPTSASVAGIGQGAESKFRQLAMTWKAQTGHLSNVSTRCTHPAYQQIIGMGKTAIPLILRDLKETREDWFWALTAITGENPIPAQAAGNIKEMTEAWLRWGRDKGYNV